MTIRTWVYKTLTTTPSLVTFIGGLSDPRVFAKKSMSSAKELHPYIVYKLGNNTSEELSEEVPASRQYLQIFVHDFADVETGDYISIDKILKEIKAAFHLASSPSDGVIITRYLETSQDLSDETLSTVMKYIRFQIITKE